jgi:hypothetical protein
MDQTIQTVQLDFMFPQERMQVNLVMQLLLLILLELQSLLVIMSSYGGTRIAHKFQLNTCQQELHRFIQQRQV